MIFIINSEGLIEFANHGISGYKTEEIIGKKVSDFTKLEYRKRETNAIKQVFTEGRPSTYIAKGPGPNGSDAWYETTIGPIFEKNKIVNAVLIATDITKHRKEGDEMRVAQQSFEEKMQELEQVNNLMSGRELKIFELKDRLAKAEEDNKKLKEKINSLVAKNI